MRSDVVGPRPRIGAGAHRREMSVATRGDGPTTIREWPVVDWTLKQPSSAPCIPSLTSGPPGVWRLTVPRPVTVRAMSRVLRGCLLFDAPKFVLFRRLDPARDLESVRHCRLAPMPRRPESLPRGTCWATGEKDIATNSAAVRNLGSKTTVSSLDKGW